MSISIIKRSRGERGYWIALVPSGRLTATGNPQRVEKILGRCNGPERISKTEAANKLDDFKEEVARGDVDLSRRDRRLTLAALQTEYIDRRTKADGQEAHQGRRSKKYVKLSEGSLTEARTAFTFLKGFFGETRLVSAIDNDAAELFLDAYEAGELAKHRDTTYCKTYPKIPSEQTVRKLTRTTKAIFGWAAMKKIIRSNPFQSLDGTVLESEPPYFPLELYTKIQKHCTAQHAQAETPADADRWLSWSALFALARLGGLRRIEALSLRWSGQTKDKKGRLHDEAVALDDDPPMIRLVSRKTWMHRAIPIADDLEKILRAIHTARKPAADDRVVRLAASSITGEDHLRAVLNGAGVALPAGMNKPFQSMRYSRRKDLQDAGIDRTVIARWTGHRVTTAEAHYGGAAPTPAELALARRGRPT